MKKKLQILLAFLLLGRITNAQPDLAIVGNINVVAPNPVHVGITINVTFSVQNTGTAAAGLSHTGIYLQGSGLATPILLSKISMQPVAVGTTISNIQFNYPIPYTVTKSGDYAVVIKLNDNGEVNETTSSNNSASAKITINQDPWSAKNLPYPIIFVHGFVGDNTAWNEMIDSLRRIYGWSYGGNMNFSLNYDGNLNTSNKNDDYKDFTNVNALQPNDFFTVNFDVDNDGTWIPYQGEPDDPQNSNQAAIVKQGLAISDAIDHVLAKTGRNKVILVCHSMGGLAAREYLQNPSIWNEPGLDHHVAKLLTIGTPHGGCNATEFGLTNTNDQRSEAVRDMRTNYRYSGMPGAYLFHGIEGNEYMEDHFFGNFHNVDVNCNDNTGESITGINHKNIPFDLSYSCIIGTGKLGGDGDPFISGDGVVAAYKANLNNYRYVNADTFILQQPLGNFEIWHTQLEEQFKGIIRGMDEANNGYNNRAYEISADTIYYGNITYQSADFNARDYDQYRIYVPSAGILNIQVFNIPTSFYSVYISNSSLNTIYTENSHGKSHMNINVNVTPGYYHISMSGLPFEDSYKYPYSFICTVNQSTILCNSTTTLTATTGTINDGSGTNDYNNNSDCKWVIQPSGATSITLTFSAFKVSNTGDTVYVYDGGTTQSPLLDKFTGATLPSNITSTGGVMLVRFLTNATTVAAGWTANYTAVIVPTYCNGNTAMTAASGTFSDGSGIADYGNSSRCSWLISPAGAYSITVNFLTFNTEAGNDIVNVYDGNNNASVLLGTFSGNSIPVSLTSSGGAMFVEFVTNDAVTASGWNASYSSYIPYPNTGIVKYEYWFDNNYANGISTPVMPQAIFQLNTNVSTNNLLPGLHTFNIRFKDNTDKWSSTSSNFFYKSNSIYPAGSSQYEYWFDNDYSNRKSTNISSTSNLLLLDNISINSLSNGLHTFNIRFKPDGKNWSSAISNFFYKEPSFVNNTIVSYRYWFDSASSEMKTVNLSAPLKSLQLMSDINTNNLAERTHVIHFQFKDSLHKWSSVISDTFSKAASVQLGAINGNTSVCQGSTQTYSVAAIGCATSYTWTLPAGWTGSSTTHTIITKAGTTGGTITVKANGNCGTNNIQTLNVTASSPPPAAIAAAGQTTFCAGKNVLLKATTGTGYTYQWKKAGVDLPNQTSSNYTADATSIYSVVVTNATGCSATSAGTNVTVNPVPVATVAAGVLSVCKGKTVSLRAVTGSGYIYQWRRGAIILPETSSTYTATESGNYSVIVTNASGCKDTSEFFNVVINPLPLATITPNGPTKFCSKGEVILRANSGVGYTYQWKRGGTIIPGQTSFTYTATTTGSYEVVVTNASGCSKTSGPTKVLVNPLPLATIAYAGSLTLCSPGSVVLRANTGTGYTYQWKKAGVNITDNGTSVNYTAKTSGVYSVAVTNSFGCTVISQTVTVTVNNAPVISLVPATSPNICAGQSVLLKATVGTGYTYKWRRSGILLPETLSTYQAKETGVYTVEVTNAAGCSVVSKGITVTVTPIPVTKVAIAGPTTFCHGEKVQLKATVGAGYIYQWRKDGGNIPNAVNSTYEAVATGVYTVWVKNAQGCTAVSDEIAVTVKPAPVTTITHNGPLNFKEGGSVSLLVPLVNGHLYQWKKNGSNIPSQTSNSFLAIATGSYSVSVTGLNGCVAVSSPVQVSVTPGRPITKVINDDAEFFTVYPNPLYRSDYLNIELSQVNTDKGLQVTVSDIAGRLIETRQLEPYDRRIRIRGASGIYIVEVRWGINQRKIFRVIKIE